MQGSADDRISNRTLISNSEPASLLDASPDNHPLIHAPTTPEDLSNPENDINVFLNWPTTTSSKSDSTESSSKYQTFKMSLTSHVHDSLPYIDAEPTPTERAAALALIQSELDPSLAPDALHPSMPTYASPSLSPLILQEHERIAAQQPLNAIDTTRYESQEAPEASSSSSSSNDPETTSHQWRTVLHRAYTSHTYLSTRRTNLSLLERYGKNAWLIGNAQLEHILLGVERDFALRKEEIDRVVIERKNAQEAVAGEVKSLEETWKRGVGRVLETEVAAEGVRREILEIRREGAS